VLLSFVALRVRRFLIDDLKHARLKITPAGTIILDFVSQLPHGIWFLEFGIWYMEFDPPTPQFFLPLKAF